ncbi:hypothetical protein FJTKL_06377 [Diaporthe vaccinii]|uniref:Uncharacterized protein n=1 Tax=Diaporthe vaccinii TaxID=105482 RepID=A0ABR4EWK7_9PEZI
MECMVMPSSWGRLSSNSEPRTEGPGRRITYLPMAPAVWLSSCQSVSLTLARRLLLAAPFPETLTSHWLRKLPPSAPCDRALASFVNLLGSLHLPDFEQQLTPLQTLCSFPVLRF